MATQASDATMSLAIPAHTALDVAEGAEDVVRLVGLVNTFYELEHPDMPTVSNSSKTTLTLTLPGYLNARPQARALLSAPGAASLPVVLQVLLQTSASRYAIQREIQCTTRADAESALLIISDSIALQ